MGVISFVLLLCLGLTSCSVEISTPANRTSTPADTTPPDAPTGLDLQTPATSPSGSATPTIRVSGVVSGDTVSLYTDSSCLVGNLRGSAVASGTTVDVTSSSLAVGSYVFYARSVDPSGNASTCSTASRAYQRINAASLSITSHTSPYDFGGVTIGTAPAITFTVTNSGGITATSLVFSGYTAIMDRTNPGGSNCGVSLASGATCQLQITYTPATSVTTSETLNIAYTDAVSTVGSYDFTVTGTGQTEANISLSSSEFNFGTTLGGVPSPIQTLTLTNNGEATATSIGIDTMTDFFYPTGAYPGTATNPCGTDLAGGASCNISVYFVPTRDSNSNISGMRYETPSLTYQTALSSPSLSLRLRGRSELLRVGYYDYTRSNRYAYGAFDFGDVGVGRTNYRVVTLQNPTSVSVTLDSSGLSFTNGFSFAGGTYPGSGGPGNTSGKSPCGATLAGNSECELIFSFTPTSTGAKVFNADIVESDSGNSELILRIYLEGEGITAPTCACNPAGFPFGGGSGTVGSPFQVCSATQFQLLHGWNSLTGGWSGNYFTQCSNIALGTVPSIGRGQSETQFKGTYDGNFYSITAFRQYEGTCSAGMCDGGLFYRLDSSSMVKNVHLFAAIVEGGDVSDPVAGGIAKFTDNDNQYHISNVIVTGAVTSKGVAVGGIIGSGSGISNSFSTASVYGADDHDVNNVGGLIGSGGTIGNSYSTGNVEGVYAANGVYVGGLVGSGSGISQSFMIGSVSSNEQYVGGILGLDSGGFNVVGEGTESVLESANFGSVTGTNFVGGIAGNNAFAYLENVSNFGSVTGQGSVGGIVGLQSDRVEYGRNYGSVLGSSAAGTRSGFGGITGNHFTGSIAYAEVDAAITIPSNRVGGSIGGIAGNFAQNSGFHDNVFRGSISSSNASTSAIGGLVGGVASGLGIEIETSLALPTSIDVSASYGACTGADVSDYSPSQLLYWYTANDRMNGVPVPDYSALSLRGDGCASRSAAGLQSLTSNGAWDFSTIWEFPDGFWSEALGLQ